MIPDSNLVLRAWLSTIVGLETVDNGPTLPPVENWWQNGFIQYAVIGGQRDNYLTTRHPIVRFNTYATRNKNANYKPAWDMASDMAEKVIAATLDEDNLRRLLTLPTGYPNCRLLEAHSSDEPVQVDNQKGNFGRFTFTARFHWVVES